MKKISIYVDTSVIGGGCDPEFNEWSCRLLSHFQSGIFSLLLSTLIDAEIQEAPDECLKIAEYRVLKYEKTIADVVP